MKIFLRGRWSIVNCYHGKAGLSLSEEARTKDNGADNAQGGFALGIYQALRRNSPKAGHAGILIGSNALKGRQIYGLS